MRCRRPGFDPWVGKIPLERGKATHSSIYWASLVVQTAKNMPAMQTRVQSLDEEDPPEKGMATHSSILAWRMPWTEEPSGLQSMGSQSRTELSD